MARLLDGLFEVPVTAAVIVVALLIAAPDFGPIFPRTTDSSTTSRTPGFVWVELTIVAISLVMGALYVVYEVWCTKRWGRTPGKAIMHIRPLKTTGSPLSWGAAFGREGLYRVGLVVGMIGLIDPLWCLWDGDRQCLHDKAASTIVVQD